MRVSILRTSSSTTSGNLLRILLIIVPILIIGALYWYFSSQPPALAEIISPTRVLISNYSPDSVKISFATPNKNTQATLIWGENSSLGITQTDDRVSINAELQTHSFTLSDLKQTKKYYYRIKIGNSFFPAISEVPSTFVTPTTSEVKRSPITTIYGDIDSSNPINTLIYAYVQTSTGDALPLSIYPKTDGSWLLDVSQALTTSGRPVVVTETTKVRFVFDAGSSGSSQSLTAEKAPYTISLTAAYNFDSVFASSDFTNDSDSIVIVQPTTIGSTTPTATPTITPTTLTGPINFSTLQQNIQLSSESSQSSSQSVLFNLYASPTITNVTNTSFSTFWITPLKEETKIVYGLANSTSTVSKQDDRDSGSPSQYFIHYSTLSLLTAETDYTFIYGNNSGNKSLTTPTALGTTPQFQTIAGNVQNIQGECVIQSSIQGTTRRSAKISVFVPNNGTWSMNIGPLRTQNYSNFFAAQSTETITFDLICVTTANAIKIKTVTMPVSQALVNTVVLPLE